MNIDDNHGSITIDQCGFASGSDDDRFYLIKGENIDLETFKGDFSSKHGDPPGSNIIATTNVFINGKM